MAPKKPINQSKKHVARLEHDRIQVARVRIVAIVMFVIIALLLGYGYLDTNYLQLRKPVAEVNGEKITILQWQERMQLQRVNLANLYQRYTYAQQNFGMDFTQQTQEIDYYLQNPEALGQIVIDQMVNEILIKQEADKRGITVTDAELEQSIQEKLFNYFPNGTPVPTITPTAFEYPTLTTDQLKIYPHTATPTIAPTSTTVPTSTPDLSITPTATFTAAPPTPTFVPEDVTATATEFTEDGYITQYQAALKDYKSSGVSEETLRSVYLNAILREKVQAAITADTPTTDEQVWARHILVDTESEAKAVYELLKNGSDFGRLAEQFSKDTGSGAKGGDLGWFSKGAMVAEFETAAFTQPIGEIGEPVKSQFGYHIIQVLDRQNLPLSASQLQQNRDSAFNEWLTTTKDAANLVTYDSWKLNIPPTPTQPPA